MCFCRKKVFHVPANITSIGGDPTIRKKPVYTEGQKRRAHQVGKVLYDHIANLVSSGSLFSELADRSVDIVQVNREVNNT
jgi:hypothetical protein